MRITALAFLLVSAVPVFGADTRFRVSTVDPGLDQLVERGRERSPTFRDLVDHLESQDWMIFVQAATCPDRATIACVPHFVGSIEGRRYIRVLINRRGRLPDEVVVLLAHELQHALEIVSDGNVTDGDSIRELMRRISNSRFVNARTTIYETAAAQRIGEAVSRELRKR
jgi:hypothetical protein